MKAFTLARLTIVLTMAAAAVAVTTAPASAQDATAAPASPMAAPLAVEVTPFISLDSRGSTPVGAAIAFPLTSRFSIETEVGVRQGESGLHMLSSSANLLCALPRTGRATPYLAAGAGLAQYGAPVVSPGGVVVGTDARVAVEVNAGGGVKVPVNGTWGMRTDARWFKSFGRDGSEHWRVSQGISFKAGTR
jgi:hypothetical protein